MLHKLGLATVVKTPITGTDMWLVGFAYVDDSDLFTLSLEHNVEATVDKMQKIVDAWEKAAKITGGAIAPQKCWWYLVTYEWDKHCNWKYGRVTNKYSIKAKDADEKIHTIQLLESDEAQEMLGVHLAPDGNNKKQFEEMMKKATEYSERMRTGYVHRHEAWLGLTSMATKSLEYCLPATTLSESQCNQIMWKLIQSFLPKSGINRYIKRDVLYSPVSLQGLGLKNLYILQGLYHINDIIEHTWKQSITGHFIMTSLEALRLELGINKHILNSKYEQYESLIMTPSWISDTWRFISEHDIKLDVDPAQLQSFLIKTKYTIT